MLAPVNCDGCPYVVPAGTLSLLDILPELGIFTNALAMSFNRLLTGTVIIKVCVGQLEI